MEMGIATAAGLVIGYALDEYFETEPVFTIVFFFFGLAGGVVTFIKLWKFLKEKI